MPLWCAADHSHEEGGETSSATPLRSRPDRPPTSRRKAHSRVVRISPGDSVVLNSAERAPFLLHVEVLEGDLDFDPSRRENRELLKKIVVQEDLKRRKKEHGYVDAKVTGRPVPNAEGFGSPMPDAVPATPERKENGHDRLPSRNGAFPTAERRDVKPEEVEEVDLVEQLYGAKLSVRDVLPDLNDSLPLPSAPKNKQLDAVAWNRAGSSSQVPSRRNSFGTPTSAFWPADSPVQTLSMASPTAIRPDTPGRPETPLSAISSVLHDGAVSSPNRVITLEDYSERMRTAAVMLAQLNASLIPAAPDQTGQASSGARSWIPGTGWITGTKDPEAQAAGGKLKLAAVQAAAIRDRIMEEMMALEEERVARMTDRPEGVWIEEGKDEGKTAEDEGIVRRELNKADPSGGSGRRSGRA